jgi:anti-sigma factor RsiW
MRVLTSDRLGRWTRGIGIVALVALAWAVFVPDGLFWTALLAAGLIGSAVATAFLVRSRRIPSLAQVIASAEASPVAVPAGNGYTSVAGIRPSPRGERKP